MKARFDGTCIKCGLPIKGFVNHPSDAHEIQWTRKPRPDGLQRAAWHEACNSLPDNPATVKIMRDRQDKRLGEIQPQPLTLYNIRRVKICLKLKTAISWQEWQTR